MFIVMKNNGTSFEVLDTRDKSKSELKYNEIKALVKSGLVIRGCTLDNKNDKVKIKCRLGMGSIDSFVKDIDSALARAKMLGSINIVNTEQEVIKSLAVEYGFYGLSGQSLKVSLRDKLITMNNDAINGVLSYSEGESKFLGRKFNVMKPRVEKLSRLGYESFEFMYLKCNGVNISIQNIMDALMDEIDGGFNNFMYIGSTIDEKLFIVLRNGKGYRISLTTDVSPILRQPLTKARNSGDLEYKMGKYFCNSLKDTDKWCISRIEYVENFLNVAWKGSANLKENYGVKYNIFRTDYFA